MYNAYSCTINHLQIHHQRLPGPYPSTMSFIKAALVLASAVSVNAIDFRPEIRSNQHVSAGFATLSSWKFAWVLNRSGTITLTVRCTGVPSGRTRRSFVILLVNVLHSRVRQPRLSRHVSCYSEHGQQNHVSGSRNGYHGC